MFIKSQQKGAVDSEGDVFLFSYAFLLCPTQKAAKVAGVAALCGAGMFFAAPAAVGLLGFTSGGITAGSAAAGGMSAAAAANGVGVASGSAFAALQSIGAGGTALAAVSKGAAAVGGAATALYQFVL